MIYSIYFTLFMMTAYVFLTLAASSYCLSIKRSDWTNANKAANIALLLFHCLNTATLIVGLLLAWDLV